MSVFSPRKTEKLNATSFELATARVASLTAGTLGNFRHVGTTSSLENGRWVF